MQTLCNDEIFQFEGQIVISLGNLDTDVLTICDGSFGKRHEFLLCYSSTKIPIRMISITMTQSFVWNILLYNQTSRGTRCLR